MHASGIHSFLSSRTFTPFQLHFLSNGLRFICTPPKSHLPSFIQHFLADDERGWQRFSRTLTQRVLFQDKEQGSYIAKFALPHKSNPAYLQRLEDSLRADMGDELRWLQQYRDQTLRLLTGVVSHPNNTAAVSSSSSNHSLADRLFIQELLRDASITIKPADKNLGLAFVDTSWYRAELRRMLADTVTYKKLATSDRSLALLKTQLLAELKKLAGRRKSTLDLHQPEHADKMFDFLTKKVTADTAAIPNIYLLIKVHKPKGLCGRPIVPCTRWITTPASVLADHLLQAIIKKADIPWLVKDTKSLVNSIERTVIPPGAADGLFVTADIASLYTNIDTDMGLALVRTFLTEQKVAHDLKTLIMDLLSFVMRNAYLSFNGQVFHQVDGTAMGTAVAPSYANVVVYMLERDVVKRFTVAGSLYTYWRYLDDIFALIHRSAASSFRSSMNQLHRKLTFEFVTEEDSAAFLDLSIFKGARFHARGVFDTRVHQKKMNLYLYIPFHSFHTAAAKRSFILTELMRYIRNSSDEADYNGLKQLFFQRLRDRGYPSKFLEPEFSSIHYCDRHYFLSDSAALAAHPLIHTAPPRSRCLLRRLACSATPPGSLPLVFIVPFTPLSSLVPTRQVLLDRWHLLADTRALPSCGKPIIAYQSAPSLAKALVFTKEKRNEAAAKPAATVQTSLRSFFRRAPAAAAAAHAATALTQPDRQQPA